MNKNSNTTSKKGLAQYVPVIHILQTECVDKVTSMDLGSELV